jgi:hypothetical protein
MFQEYFSDLYDYSGGNFYIKEDISYFYGGVNGGFSLRNKNTMLECIEKITWEKIGEYRKKMGLIEPIKKRNEDVFFTHACEILLKFVPDKFHRVLLAIESDIFLNTSVFHGWNRKKNYHPMDIALMLLTQSPLFSKYININKK